MRHFLTASILALLALTLPAYGENFEVIAELGKRPGNPALGPNGEIYLSMHPFDAPEFKVVRLDRDGELAPFPTPEISSSFVNVIGISSTSDGVIWMLDMGGDAQSPKLLGWSVPENALTAVHYIPLEGTGANPFFQDLAIDLGRKRAFIADMSRGDLVGLSEPAIVVIDLETGATRRLLEGAAIFQPKLDAPQRAGGEEMTFTGADGVSQPVPLGLNPIAIDETASYVYFSTITPGPVYRVPAEILGDFDKSDDEIAAAVVTVGEKETSDGIAVSGETVFLTNVDTGAIEALENGERRLVSKDPRLVWPDGLDIDKNGDLIVTANQLHKAAPLNRGSAGGKPPYLVVRIQDEN
ncbi:L-dopachrome tautomerase-related protein [Leisingera sp. SS27]|uniref:L-dopachrome tautomerase-related protein n=1 Tax=Leisingera sp. SS27 TaxID=2979462 RepID=UPI00232C8F8E|nr:L-dopachrome tautomerase-related protein [Leisingera sp. SS27]MDC0660555.1 L-dopachrome tautomerase-related protein [Leisingera sp. SS27]